MIINLDNFQQILPYALGLVTTILALKKDWIASKFTKKEMQLDIAITSEDVESKALDNVQKTLEIYRGIVHDLKDDMTELKLEINELKGFIEEQKIFIKKQSKALAYYESKYGKMNE